MLRIVVFVTLLSAVTGSDVVLGVVGKSAFIECQLPVTRTLAWQTMSGYIIAVDGKLTNENNTKYVIETQQALRESLVVRDLTLADDTSYKCFDLNNAAVYDVTKLNILARPPRMNLTSPQNALLEGTSVNFTCEADGGKPLPEVEWFLKYANGTVRRVSGNVKDMAYVNGTGHRVNTLTMNVTRDLYGASVTCNISVSVLFQETFTVNTNVLLAPRQPVISGYYGSFDENTKLPFVCSSNGSLPTASIYWLLNGNKLGDVEVVVKPEDNGTFLVTSLFSRMMSRDYNGSVLSCAVTNDVLRQRGLPPLMTSVLLLASYKPEITREQEEYTVEQNGNVTLNCYIQGNPAPKFDQLYWTHKDTVIDRRYYRLSNDSATFSLMLENVDASNAGNFSCHGANRLGTAISKPIQLQVLYVPFCATDMVEKHAVWMGKSLRLNCNVEAVPTNVLFTWRYEKSQEIISANQSNDNLSNDKIAHGMLDLTITSQSQYNMIECKGRNSVGMSVKPCRYNIVPPGPPDAPSNCSTQIDNAHITVKCNIGFNGGSTQHFVLQKLIRSQYETILTEDLPSFTFDSYQNVTIRVCAFNDDYQLSSICAIPLAVVVDQTVLPQSDEVKEGNSHRTAYIAGGVVACLGVVIIAILLVVLILRRYKKDLTLENEAATENKISKQKMLKEWWKRNISRRNYTKESTIPPCPVTPSIRKSQVVTNTDIEANDVPFQDIVSLARKFHNSHQPFNYNHLVSTPRHNTKCAALQISVDTNADIEMGQLQAPNVLNESTGFALSPIQNENSIRYLDEVTEIPTNVNTTDFDTKDEGMSNCYNTHDILDGLSDSEASVEAKYVIECPKSKSLTKTLDKDYSCGDIVDALDQIVDTSGTANIQGDAIGTKTEHEFTICGRNMSSIEGIEDIDESVTILKFRDWQDNVDITDENTCAVLADTFSNHGSSDTDNTVSMSNNPDIKEIDTSDASVTMLYYARSSPNTSASMMNNLSTDTAENKPVVLRSPLRVTTHGHRNKTARCLEKSYSLPIRSRNQLRPTVTRTFSTSDLNNDESSEPIGSVDFQGRNCVKSNFIDRFLSDHTNNTSLVTLNRPENDIQLNTNDHSTALPTSEVKCDLSLTIDNEPNDNMNSNMSKSTLLSTLTDGSDLTFDINNFTLTVSEPGRSYENRSNELNLTDYPLCDIDSFTLTVASEQSATSGSIDTLDNDNESRKALELMSSTRSFEDSLGYDQNVTKPRDIHRSGSFLEAVMNNSAFESDTTGLETSSKQLSDISVDTEISYFNHGYEMDSESTIDDTDNGQSDLEQDVNTAGDKHTDDLDKSENSDNVVLYI